jgi:hypothetical protein
MSRQQHWGDDAVALLRTLWPDHSATIIAQALVKNCRMTTTRNAVIGKANRLALEKGSRNIAESKNPGNRPPERIDPRRSNQLFALAMALEVRST